MISYQDQWARSKDQRSKITSGDLDHPKDQDHPLGRSFREIKIVILPNLDIRLIREREAADATVRRICLCSLGGQRGCRCEDNSEEWPIDIILVHHGKDVGIRLQDPNVWSMTF